MARSLLRVGVTELLRHPGTQRDIDVASALPGLAITSARVPADAELAVDATLESIEGGAVTVTGTVRVPWEAECRRCLDPVRGEETVEVREVFEPHPTPGETYPLDGEELDLEPVVRDAALLNLPLAPLCREDCPGPSPGLLPATGDGDDTAPEPARDSRWAALDELRLEP